MDISEKKRKTIRQKVSSMVLAITVISLLLTSLIGVFSMLRIQKKSKVALLNQTVQKLHAFSEGKAKLADLELRNFLDCTSQFADYINDIYKNPSHFKEKEVLPPDAKNGGTWVLQRTFASEKNKYIDVKRELNLLGNVEQIFKPIIHTYNDKILSIYIATENGFMVSYDPNSDNDKANDGISEVYYDYFNSPWYLLAKNAGKTCFTDVYSDSFEHGLMISCASPFYDAEKNFKGVVCMDVLISDLYNATVNVSDIEGAYAFLIDTKGNAISPAPVIASIFDDKNLDDSIREKMLNKENNVELTSHDVYYAYSPLETTDWEFCICIPQKTVLEPVADMARHIRIAIIIFAILMILIIAIVTGIVQDFAQTLTRPLESLVEDVKIISKGNFERRARAFENDEIGDLASCVNAMSVSLQKYISDLTAVTAEKERIGAELNVATKIQADMLPQIYPAFPDHKEFDLFGTMDPAKEVGGDLYDYLLLDDDHLMIVVGDVSGKGVPAALFMVIAKTLLETHSIQRLSPSEIFQTTNNELCKGNETGLFVTCWLGIITLSTGEMRFVNAGHPFPVLYHNGEFDFVKTKPNFVLGGMDGLPFTEHTITLEKGDRLLVYTDGVTEATDANEKLFGDDRLLAAMKGTEKMTAPETCKALRKSIDEFVGDAEQFDDITMLQLILKE